MNFLRQATIEVCGLRQKNNRWRKVYRWADAETKAKIQGRKSELFRDSFNKALKHFWCPGEIEALAQEEHAFLNRIGVGKEAGFVGDTKPMRLEGMGDGLELRSAFYGINRESGPRMFGPAVAAQTRARQVEINQALAEGIERNKTIIRGWDGRNIIE